MGLRDPVPAIDQMYQMQMFDVMIMFLYSLLHLECHFNLNFQSQSPWCLFSGTWQKSPRELDYGLRFEIGEMTLQMQ